jgi:hypothetical protein
MEDAQEPLGTICGICAKSRQNVSNHDHEDCKEISCARISSVDVGIALP